MVDMNAGHITPVPELRKIGVPMCNSGPRSRPIAVINTESWDHAERKDVIRNGSGKA
jgi:hypothetical protein